MFTQTYRSIFPNKKLFNSSTQIALMENEKGLDYLKGALLVLIMLSILIILIWAKITGFSSRSFDNNLCDKSKPLFGHTVVLYDATDKLTPTQISTINREIYAIKSRVKVGERLTLFALNQQEGGKVLQRIFSLCRPLNGENANPLTENQEMLAKTYTNKFENPFIRAVNTLHNYPSASTSPLMEALYEISLMPEFSSQLPSRHLLVVSDMLQNSKNLTHYQKEYYFDNVLQDRLLYVNGIKNRFRNVDLSVYQLSSQRTRSHQTNYHDRFWTRYFGLAGINKSQYQSHRL